EENQQIAFEILKRYLIIAPILRYLDFKEMVYLYTDVSSIGLRAVLAQKDKDHKEYVVVYASWEKPKSYNTKNEN
ncbi:4660_t:CDS:2, partial [Dentiscutata heterogama]